MKKLTRKLFLSIAALAVCAATMVSTTFAWYVQNTEATASGMTASTAEATGDGSIYVSKDGTAFTKSVTITTSDYAYNGTLDPVTTDDGTLAEGKLTFKNVSGDSDTTHYIQFSLWIKSDKAITCKPSLTVTNGTLAFKKQTAYQSITEDVTAGQEFYVDAVQALRMAVQKESEETATIYDLQKIATEYEVNVQSVKEEDLTTDAHAYYNQIMGKAANDTTPAEAETTWANYTLEANKAVKLTFFIWLDGADKSCFDSCVGQNFTFTLSFSVAGAAGAEA